MILSQKIIPVTKSQKIKYANLHVLIDLSALCVKVQKCTD